MTNEIVFPSLVNYPDLPCQKITLDLLARWKGIKVKFKPTYMKCLASTNKQLEFLNITIQ